MELVDPRKLPFVTPKTRGELPHLYKDGCTYFVTFRLADAVPSKKKGQSAQKNESSCDDPAKLLAEYDPPLNLGKCQLQDPRIASLVQEALRHFDGTRYHLLAWCTMPNHVHVIVTPCAPYSVSQVLQSWKGFTARRGNELLNRSGPFWERESFDHLVRSAESLEKFVQYVLHNPVAAGLCTQAEDWPYSGVGAGVVPAK